MRQTPPQDRMSPDQTPPAASRLSRIDTLWSVVRRAHDSQPDAATAAQQQLLDLYGGAIRRYLLAALRNREAADELFQDFSLKFLRGDFRQVTPERGRFRAFVKTVLYRMVALHFREQGRQKEHPLPHLSEQAFATETPSLVFEQQFFDAWREDLLAKTWQALAEYEANGGGPYHTVLRLRVANPALSTKALAEQIGQEIGKATSPGSGRVLVHRAREKFASLLIDIIADSLEEATHEAIESELIDLQLIDYCRDALAARSGAP